MLDSGAYSVHTRGATIDLDDYIAFCSSHPEVSYYVALDVMPGTAQNRSLTTEQIDESCAQSVKNYREMIQTLPIEKVIPVFHYGEDWSWLEMYIDMGCPYIGISLGGRTSGPLYQDWLGEVKKYVLDSEGKPIVKTHGFGLTSFPVMKFMPWHSVDSASWVRNASYGSIWIPKFKDGQFRYDIPPDSIYVSPKSPEKNDKYVHLDTLSAVQRKVLEAYLVSLGDPGFGEFETVEVDKDYKKKTGELEWESKARRDGPQTVMKAFNIQDDRLQDPDVIVQGEEKKRYVLRVLKRGLATCHQLRFMANSTFLRRANKYLPVENIYFAGAVGSVDDKVEFTLKRRLISFHDVVNSKNVGVLFRRYMDIIRNSQKASKDIEE